MAVSDREKGAEHELMQKFAQSVQSTFPQRLRKVSAQKKSGDSAAVPPQTSSESSSMSTQRSLYRDRWQREVKWFSEPYAVPNPSCLNDDNDLMETFKHLIWDHDPLLMLPKYDATPEELSRLCGDGLDGCVVSRHISWVLNRLNSIPGRCTTAFVVDSIGRGLLSYLAEARNQGTQARVRYLLFIMRVRMEADGKVFVDTSQEFSSHWTVAAVSLEEGKLVYCDPLGWKLPEDLVQRLAPVLQMFQMEGLVWSIFLAHDPAGAPQNHQCGEKCLNYPVQLCSSDSGIVAIVFAARFVLKNDPFVDLMKGKVLCQGTFFDQPDRYSRYLRRKVITWFVTGVIDVSFLGEDTKPRPLKEENSSPDKLPPPERENSSRPQGESGIEVSTSLPDQQRASHSNTGNLNSSTCRQDQQMDVDRDAHAGVTDSRASVMRDPNTDSEKSGIVSSGTNTGTTASIETTKGTSFLATLLREAGNDPQLLHRTSKTCPHCLVPFSTRKNMIRHVKNKHPKQDHSCIQRVKGSFHCCDCGAVLGTVRELIHHHRTVHEKVIHIQTAHMSSKEFDQWKKEVEENSLTRFTKGRCRLEPSRTVAYFSCHRSGTARLKPDNERKNAHRVKGTCKISGKCTAFMTTFCSPDGKMRVEYCVDHVGHDLELSHLQISHERVKALERLSRKPGGEKYKKRIEDIYGSVLYKDRESKDVQKYFREAIAAKLDEFKTLVGKTKEPDTLKAILQHVESTVASCKQLPGAGTYEGDDAEDSKQAPANLSPASFARS